MCYSYNIFRKIFLEMNTFYVFWYAIYTKNNIYIFFVFFKYIYVFQNFKPICINSYFSIFEFHNIFNKFSKIRYTCWFSTRYSKICDSNFMCISNNLFNIRKRNSFFFFWYAFSFSLTIKTFIITFCCQSYCQISSPFFHLIYLLIISIC